MPKTKIRFETVDSHQVLALCRDSMRCTSSLLAGLPQDPFNPEQVQVLNDLSLLATNAHRALEELLEELRQRFGSGPHLPEKP